MVLIPLSWYDSVKLIHPKISKSYSECGYDIVVSRGRLKRLSIFKYLSVMGERYDSCVWVYSPTANFHAHSFGCERVKLRMYLMRPLTHTRTYTYMFPHIHTHNIQTRIRTDTHNHARIQTRTHTSTRTHISTRTRTSTRTSAHVEIPTHKHTRTNTRTCTRIMTLTQTYKHTHTHMHAQAHIQERYRSGDYDNNILDTFTHA